MFSLAGFQAFSLAGKKPPKMWGKASSRLFFIFLPIFFDFLGASHLGRVFIHAIFFPQFFGKCKSAASILQKRPSRNAEWENNLRTPERFQHKQVNREGKKRCACCGREFTPTRYREDDRKHCNDKE